MARQIHREALYDYVLGTDVQPSQIAHKRVFLRADLNVPLDGNQQITDTSRLDAVLPTVEFLSRHAAKVMLASHLGRPQPENQSAPERRNQFSLAPVAAVLAAKLGSRFVGLAEDCVGTQVASSVDNMAEGQVLLLENTRFHAGDLGNSDEFAAQLAANADVFVNDAFGVLHRDQASVTGVVRHVPVALMGPLVRREVTALLEAIDRPRRPFVVVLGGAKVVDKIGIIRVLLQKADRLLIGGKMAFTFLKANGVSVGDTEIEAGGKYLDVALEMQAIAAERQVSLLLPVDQLVARSLTPGAVTSVTPLDTTCCTPEKPCIRDGYQGGDIGPATQRLFAAALDDAGTVFWNGPLGKFETPEFAEGTFALARAMASATARGAITVVGGGDSVSAVRSIGLNETNFTHISTGGGASLEFIQDPWLPGIRAIVQAAGTASVDVPKTDSNGS